ncbi:MAG: alanine--tRNA ligase [Bacteroidota bacterium]|nr:alanine--tRNA ligase [Bacteroidota bacterium]
MTSAEIRKTFLDFFAEKGHQIVASAPIVMKNDPTLLFTNAGMNQFKDYFLGNAIPEIKRVADTQKCLRATGKHNDLEEVGYDTYHHTMFEMLGNWSFGDYFKKEAIAWAWELLINRFQLDRSRLYITVFEGDTNENLEKDTESYNFWKEFIDESHIINGSKKDNFWEMGDQGPCGPCTEIHFDNRPDKERSLINGQDLVNNDHPQVIEIWNLVFMQYNRLANGSLEKLPAQHVDTGMGFERLVRAIQGKNSNYDTDVFLPLINQMELDFNLKYGANDKVDVAIRVIADHIRTVSFTIADGQLPGNALAGYVIRRILRRAVRYAYTSLQVKEPYLYKLVPILATQFENVFSELKAQQEFISKVIKEEEASFLRTLALGITRFENYLAEHNEAEINGAFAFELYDTFGFPLDLTMLMAKEQGRRVDIVTFEQELLKQKNRARSAAEKTTFDWVQVSESYKHSEFVGYDILSTQSQVLRYRKVEDKDGELYQLVLDITPYYAESGGQIADTGTLEQEGQTIEVLDVRRENNVILHMVKDLPNALDRKVNTEVNQSARLDTEANHTATHLMHAALRQVLGTHVAQKGSLVSPEILRFDFSHFSKMTELEIAEVEQIVNERIRSNIPLSEERNLPIAEAKDKGAMALFGEKYGDFVRVITFDPNYSVELCGGTHANSTGQIGLFKIISESAIAAGVRRIEALTGRAAMNMVETQFITLKLVNELLKTQKPIYQAIEELKENNKQLTNEIEKLRHKEVLMMRDSIRNRVFLHQSGVEILIEKVELENANDAKNLVQDLKQVLPNVIMLLGTITEGKPNLWIAIPKHLSELYNLNAGEIIRTIAKHINGGGGGQAIFASAGGANLSGIDMAIEEGKAIIEEKLK